MNKKNTLLAFIIAAILTIPFVSADLIPAVLSDALSGLFDGLPEAWVMKFMLFWLVFAGVYAATNKIEHLSSKEGGKGVPVTISLAVGFITTLAIPDSTVELIFNLYSGLFALILILLPFAALIYYSLTAKNKTPITHAATALGFGALIVGLSLDVFQKILPSGGVGTFTWADLLSIFTIILYVLVILEIINIFKSYNAQKAKYGISRGDEYTAGQLAQQQAEDDALKAEAKRMQADNKQKKTNIKNGEKLVEKISKHKGLTDAAINDDAQAISAVDNIMKTLKDVQSYEPSTSEQKRAVENAQQRIKNDLSRLRNATASHEHKQLNNTMTKLEGIVEKKIIQEILKDEKNAQKKLTAVLNQHLRHNKITKSSEEYQRVQGEILKNQQILEQNLVNAAKRLVQVDEYLKKLQANLVSYEADENNKLNDAQTALGEFQYPAALNRLADFKAIKQKKIELLQEIQTIVSKIGDDLHTIEKYESTYKELIDKFLGIIKKEETENNRTKSTLSHEGMQGPS